MLRFITKTYKIDSFSNELYWNQFIKDGRKQKETETISYEKDLPLTMVYSSGTTGASKGILLSNDSFQNSIQSYPASGEHEETKTVEANTLAIAESNFVFIIVIL